MKRRALPLARVLALALLLVVVPAPRSAAVDWESPVVSSVTVDAQRRLVVTFSSAFGVPYGGGVYFDNDPMNATPTPGYGYMPCNNRPPCDGRFDIPANPSTGRITVMSQPLSTRQYPGGTYWVQVEVSNADPYPSTRYGVPSAIVAVTVPAKGGTDGGSADGDSGEPAESPSFAYLNVEVEEWRHKRQMLHIWVKCPNTRYFSVHAALETPSGRQFFGGVVAQGDIFQRDTRHWSKWDGYQRFRWNGGNFPDGPFVLKVWNVACWSDDSANAVGPGRRVFHLRCLGPETSAYQGNDCKLVYEP